MSILGDELRHITPDMLAVLSEVVSFSVPSGFATFRGCSFHKLKKAVAEILNMDVRPLRQTCRELGSQHLISRPKVDQRGMYFEQTALKTCHRSSIRTKGHEEPMDTYRPQLENPSSLGECILSNRASGYSFGFRGPFPSRIYMEGTRWLF